MLHARTLGSLRTCGAAVRYVFQSKQFVAACRDLPVTPSGKNPYDVLDITVTASTTLEDVSRQFRAMVVRYHPDKPGGSTEMMSEVNLAHKIIKEHHAKVMEMLRQQNLVVHAKEAYKQHTQARVSRDEELGRSGGLYRRNVRSPSASAATSSSAVGGGPATASSRAARVRSLQEILTQWNAYRVDAESATRSMCHRYELAIEMGRFFRKSANLNEITVRERWLRKSFLKGVWEDVHEMRGELLRRGARSAQQSELAEEMVQFASRTQRTLNQDFQNRTQMSVQAQSRLFVQRMCIIILSVVLCVRLMKYMGMLVFNNTLTVRFRPAVLGY